MSQCTAEDCAKLYDGNDKWRISLLSGLVFLLISSPFMYRLANTVTSMVGIKTIQDGVPTIAGLIITAIIFVIVSRLMMN